MILTSYTITFLVAVISYLQGSLATDPSSDDDSLRTKRDIPMFRMGRSLHLVRMGRSFQNRGLGPRMGRDEEEEYQQALLKQILDNEKTASSSEEVYPVEEDKEQKDRAIPYPRVGRGLSMVRMGKREDEIKRALGMIRMGKKALSGMVRMGRGLNMVRMGRGADKRGLGMIRMGKKDDATDESKRSLGLVRMGKRSDDTESE